MRHRIIATVLACLILVVVAACSTAVEPTTTTTLPKYAPMDPALADMYAEEALSYAESTGVQYGDAQRLAILKATSNGAIKTCKELSEGVDPAVIESTYRVINGIERWVNYGEAQ